MFWLILDHKACPAEYTKSMKSANMISWCAAAVDGQVQRVTQWDSMAGWCTRAHK